VSRPADAGTWQPKGLIAVLDTSTLIRAWLARPGRPSPAADVMRLAGRTFDSFTSPAILEEVETVLGRPRFGATDRAVRVWVDAFLRNSRQVFPQAIPGEAAAVVHGDLADVPILKTAYAVPVEFPEVAAAARADAGGSSYPRTPPTFRPAGPCGAGAS
jgi:predicted nucleic acid-binding protein